MGCLSQAIGIYNGVLGVGALTASVTFGVPYERFSAAAGFGTGAALAAVAAVRLLVTPTARAHSAAAGRRREC